MRAADTERQIAKRNCGSFIEKEGRSKTQRTEACRGEHVAPLLLNNRALRYLRTCLKQRCQVKSGFLTGIVQVLARLTLDYLAANMYSKSRETVALLALTYFDIVQHRILNHSGSSAGCEFLPLLPRQLVGR